MSTIRDPGDSADALFEAISVRGAYANSTTFTLPAETAAPTRDSGIARVEAASDDQDRAVIDQAIAVFAATGRPFSANQVRPVLPAIRSRRLIGARFLSAAKRGRIVRVGYVASTDPRTHSHPVAVWRGSGPSGGAA